MLSSGVQYNSRVETYLITWEQIFMVWTSKSNSC